MSNRINPIKPRKWSKAGRDFLSQMGCENLSRLLTCQKFPVGVSRQLPSRWSLGRTATPEKRVEQIITLALGQGVCLTPADLGRPDLAKKGGEG